MKSAPFDYVAAASIEEAVAELEQAGGEGVVMAGGQTLVPLLALRMSMPSVVVDINAIAEMQGVSEAAGGVRIAAGTRQSQALASALIADRAPLIRTALTHVGHVQTRSRGTVGGSVANGEPAAELPATALALGATLEVTSPEGTRDVAIDDFYIGPYATMLEPEDLVTGVRFPAMAPGSVPVFHELARRPGDFALVGFVGQIRQENGTITDAGLAWFGMGPTPMKMNQAADAMIGQSVHDIEPAAIAELAVADADPFDDALATAAYRRKVGRAAFAKALKSALENGRVPA